ncbi:MAG: hypothetical protein M0R03_04845 [Novosphingobium sp.]|nr:hypothetical protein [Novosphingobium sp.]
MADTQRKHTGGSVPITRHPLFPAIVALWFGALFGLGSLAVRPGLIEDLVVASGIDSAIPAAAPPLGATARILIALTMTGLGGLLGAVVARRIARPEPRVRQRRHTIPADRQAGAGRSGIALSRADYDDGTLEDGPVKDVRAAHDGNKRRSLAMPEGCVPLQIHEIVPVPGTDESSDRPVEIREEDAAFAARPETGPEREPAAPLPETARAPAEEEPSPAAPSAMPPAEPVAPATPTWAASRLADAIAPATPLFARTARNAACEGPQAAPVVASLPEACAAREAEPQDAAVAETAVPQRFTPPSGSAADKLLTADLDRLSPVELIERLAISMQRRRNAASAPAIPAVSLPGGLEAAATDEAPPARPVPSMPAALRPLPIGTDEAGGDEDAESLSFIPLRHIPMGEPPLPGQTSESQACGGPAPETANAGPEAPETAAEPGDESHVLEEGYSSLLDLSLRPHQRQPFVRIEEPENETDAIEPVVVFPGQGARPVATPAAPDAPETAPRDMTAEAAAAPQTSGRKFDNPAHTAAAPAAEAVDKEEADRALRAALATLQRMSGAA